MLPPDIQANSSNTLFKMLDEKRELKFPRSEQKWPMRYPPDGWRYRKSSNVAHPEDWSLDFRDMSSVQRRNNIELKALKKLFRLLPSEPVEKLANKGKFNKVVNNGKITETFTVLGHRATRIKFTGIDHKAKGNDPKAYANCTFRKAVEQQVDAGVGLRPSLEVEQWVMAKILEEKDNNLGGTKSKKWSMLNDMAQERLYVQQDLEKTVEGSIAADDLLSERHSVLLADVKQHFKRQRSNQYFQYTRDRFASNDQNILQIIKDTDIFVAVDESNAVLVFKWSRAVQALFGEKVEQDVIQACQDWTYLQMIPTQYDDVRHRMEHLDHLIRNPQFDVDKADDPHHAVCGADHYGIHCAIGHNKGPIFQTKGVKCAYFPNRIAHNRPENILHEVLRPGAFRIVTEVADFCFRGVDRALHREYVKVRRKSNVHGRFDRMKKGEPYTMLAFLAQSHTQDHQDRSDWVCGLAALVNIGDYQGGDLVLRELGLQIEFLSGDCILLRGRELYHSITPWTPLSDKGRFSFVLTTHESVRRISQGVASSENDVDEDSCRAEESDISDEESSVEDWEWNANPAEGDGMSSSNEEDEKEDTTVVAAAERSKERKRKRDVEE